MGPKVCDYYLHWGLNRSKLSKELPRSFLVGLPEAYGRSWLGGLGLRGCGAFGIRVWRFWGSDFSVYSLSFRGWGL